MKFAPVLRTIAFLLLVLEANAGIGDFFKRLFVPYTAQNQTGDNAVSIIIVKRDLAKTIAKRSFLYKNARKAGAASTGTSTPSNGSLQPCDDDQLMVYLAEIQAINPESIINLATYDDIVVICREVSDSLDKMDAYLKTCRIMNDKNLYIQFIKGVDKLYNVLCEEKSAIRKEFQQNFPCLHLLHEDFETCFGPPDWTESYTKAEICRAYKDIADCYYIKAAKVCGKQAARAMKTLVRAVIEAIVPIHCSNVMLNPKVDDPMPQRALRHQRRIL